MNRKKFLKILFIVAIFVFIVNIKAYATTEELSQIDNVAPVFDGNIQTRYVVKRADDGSAFNAQDVVKGISAVDDVDGTNVDINLIRNEVDLSRDGEYYLVYSATDKAGNTSLLCITIIVDGTGPVFAEDLENLYYINQFGVILDSKYNVVDSLPKTLTATDSVGAYKGIGVVMSTDENGNIVFVGTIANSPAVGVVEYNDILIGVNGEDVRGQTPAYVATKIKGELGTDVELKIIRSNEEKTIIIKRQVVKLYEDEEFIAEPTVEPNVEIDSISRKEDGVIEITFIATDEAGNTSEFVIRVVITESEPILCENNKTDENEEDCTDSSTSDTPPEEIDNENPVVIEENDESKENEDIDVSKENEEIDASKETEDIDVSKENDAQITDNELETDNESTTENSDLLTNEQQIEVSENEEVIQDDEKISNEVQENIEIENSENMDINNIEQ